MNVEQVFLRKNGGYVAIIDGVTWYVNKDSTENPHYIAVQKWITAGNIVEDMPNAAPEMYPPLTKIQFRTMVDNLGKENEIITAINKIEPVELRNLVMNTYHYSDTYNRDHPLFAQLAADPAVNMTSEEIDAAWLIAKDISFS